MKKLVIIGASGHGKVIADLAEQLNKYEEIYFLDDDKTKKECLGYQVIGSSKDIDKYIDDSDFVVAIGNSEIRSKLLKKLLDKNVSVATLIHPNAYVGANVQIGKGTVVMAGSVIQPDTIIGKGCIINTCASVDHECKLADYVHIAVGSRLSGNVTIGTYSWIGVGAIVSNNIDICENCIVGAGAVVVKDITESGIYVGSPAKIIKRN